MSQGILGLHLNRSHGDTPMGSAGLLCAFAQTTQQSETAAAEARGKTKANLCMC